MLLVLSTASGFFRLIFCTAVAPVDSDLGRAVKLTGDRATIRRRVEVVIVFERFGRPPLFHERAGQRPLSSV
jgi:hypothetical protein